MDLKETAVGRLNELRASRRSLVEKWSQFIDVVDKYAADKRGKNLNEWEKSNIAQCLENALIDGALRSNGKLYEATTADNISFLGVQLPVISALLPSLVLNELAVVQALDRRQGAVFYLDLVYDKAKGSVAAGSTKIGAKTGHDRTLAGRMYASNKVFDELVGTGDDTKTEFSSTLDYTPILPRTVKVVVESGNTYVDDGEGHITGTGLDSGSINYETGVISLTFTAAPGNGKRILVSYQYNLDKGVTSIGAVKVVVTSEPVAAEDFKLRTDFTLGAAIDLEKAHAINLESELVKFLGGEIKFEMDHRGIDLMAAAAESPEGAPNIGTWTATPQNSQEWLWKKYEYLDQVEKANLSIISKTLRAHCTFIVTGNLGARIIRQLVPHFQRSAALDKQKPTGPMVIGSLDGRLVVYDPFLPPDKVYYGFKGESFLFGGLAFCPYIPLFSTPTLITADTMAQKGFYSAAGYKVLNPGMFTYGTIVMGL